mgnify:CR=1 FL=1
MKKIKSRRVVLCLFAMLMFGSTVCMAAKIECMVNQTEDRDSGASAVKTRRDNSALVTVTSGPIRDFAPVIVYVKEYSGAYPNLKTESHTLYSTCNNLKLYYNNPFDSTVACGKAYRAYFRIMRYSRSNSVIVKGTLVP